MNEQSEARRASLLSLYGVFGGEGDSTASIRQLLNVLWRRRLPILLTVIVITGLAFVWVQNLQPVFSSTSEILVEPRVNRLAETASVLSGLPADFETIQTEIEILSSYSLHERVAQTLNLIEDPEFNRRLAPPSFKARMFAYFRGPPGTPSDEDVLRGTVGALSGKISISHQGRSRVISVTARSHDRRKAAMLANAVVEAYLVSQLEAKFDETERTVGWLNRRLEELRSQVRQSELAVEAYRKEANLVTGRNSMSAAEQQLSTLSSQIVLAQTRGAESQARLTNLRQVLDEGGEVSDIAVAEVLNNDLIQRLKEQESQLQRRVAVLGQRYGPRHPQMIQLQAEIADLRGEVELEVAKIIASLRNEVEIAKSRERSLLSAQRDLERNMSNIGGREIELRELEREADANRALLEAFLGRFKQLAEQEDLQTTDSRVISAAMTPIGPSHPKTFRIMIMVLLGSLGAGLGLAFLLESLDNAFRTPGELETASGLPVLSVVPVAKFRAGTPGGSADLVVSEPLSRYAESLRNLLVSMNLSNVDNPPKAIAVASTQPAEGKTTTAMALAATAASMDKRVVLMDCDLRRPSIHEELLQDRSPGIVDVLAQQHPLDDVIRHEDRLGFDFICAGQPVQNALGLIESQRFRQVLNELRDKYDLVVIDTPPMLAVTDARVLVDRCDATLFAVRWGKTPKSTVIDGLKRLEDTAAKVAGAVLTRADYSRLSSYQYGTTYYRDAYKGYYTS
ncbi:MAG: GumC family protein [Alphaproteobacteria bacterium]